MDIKDVEVGSLIVHCGTDFPDADIYNRSSILISRTLALRLFSSKYEHKFVPADFGWRYIKDCKNCKHK